MTPEFKSFDKIARLNREVVVTEKIDGTNGCIYVSEDGGLIAGSRSRWITPEDDNFGFARWVQDNAAELVRLGPGYHYGEWWGAGIGRRYDLNEKRFSLFNVGRWGDEQAAGCAKCGLSASTWAPNVCERCKTTRPAARQPRPACCSVVPVLARGPDIRRATETALSLLRSAGSLAAPGFMNPEGIVIFHTAASALFKVTLEGDEAPKSKVQVEITA